MVHLLEKSFNAAAASFEREIAEAGERFREGAQAQRLRDLSRNIIKPYRSDEPPIDPGVMTAAETQQNPQQHEVPKTVSREEQEFHKLTAAEKAEFADYFPKLAAQYGYTVGKKT